MALERPRQDVPIHFDWIDDDQYASDAGVPTSAMLGRKLIWMDRALAAHNLRGFGNAFAQYMVVVEDVPILSDVNGTKIGPFQHYASAGSSIGEWYIRAELANTEVALVVPFAESPANLEPLYGPISDTDHEMTGTGAVANYGPYSCKVVPDGMSIGVCIYPSSDGVAFEKDAIEAGGMRNRNQFVTDAAGAAKIDAWVTAVPSTHLFHMVRLLDGNDNILTPWKRIVSVTTSVPPNTSDTVTFRPAVSDAIPLDDVTKGNLQWQSVYIVPVKVYSVMFREKPAAGENFQEALDRG